MPRTGAAYCAAEDLVLGSVPLPTDGSAVKYINDAADEIDSVIALRYQTPVVIDVTANPAQRPVMLILKKLNAWLASGRLVMAADSSGADDQLQQYGLYLVTEAYKTLNQIASGEIQLPAIPSANPDAVSSTGPVASFADETSLVEAHKEVYGNPAEQAMVNATVRLPYSNYPYLPYVY